jgi:DNA polymerase-3 subunit delta
VPPLSLAALEKALVAGRLSPVHLFTGDDARLIDETIARVEATVDPADRPFAVERLYAGDAGGTPIDIAAAARVLPMLGDRRIVVVLRAERLLKPKRAARAAAGAEVPDGEDDSTAGEPADVVPLEDYLASPVDSTSLIFVASEIDRTRRFTRRLLETAQVTMFAGLAGAVSGPAARGEAAAWVQQALAAAGRTIDRDAVQVLVERAGGSIAKLRGDVERLLLYTEGRRRITADDAQATVTGGVAVDDEWAVTNAIAAGDAARALREAGRRLERGDSPHALLGQLRWWVSARLAESDPDRVRFALDALLRTDLALKSSGGDERVLVERLVVELTGGRRDRVS